MLTEFFFKPKIQWEELEIYKPVPTYTCRIKCACEALQATTNNHQLFHSMNFLTSLNDNYEVIKSHILILDPLPPLKNIFSMILQHENQLVHVFIDDSKALKNSFDSHKFNPKFGKSSSTFKPHISTCCNRIVHTIKIYQKKHGLPPHLHYSNSYVAHGVAFEGSESETNHSLTS